MGKKVTLKVGDILCVIEGFINDPEMSIIGFTRNRVLLNHSNDGRPAYYIIDNDGKPGNQFSDDFFYVNGIKYDREDIIVPNIEYDTQSIAKGITKITLKIGDVLCCAEDFINHPDMMIVKFKKHKILLNHRCNGKKACYRINSNGNPCSRFMQHDFFYINGVKYAQKDIIVPSIDVKKRGGL